MALGKMVFKEDEVERLQTKIRLVSQDTNRLYLQLRGQTNNWGGIPLGPDLVRAQTLINELRVEAEKLEDIIRGAIKGVQGAQDENKRQANQLFQQLGVLGGMFERFGGGSAIGQSSIPTTAQKAVTNLITSVATLMGWDELKRDPMVQKLQATVKNSGLGTIDSIAAQSKLKDIYLARDQIAKAQTAYKVYQTFGNQAQMDAMHKLAEDARKKLKSLGIDEVQYQAGKDLSTYFKKPVVKACDYDPSITSRSVPLVQNEAYQLLLRTAMEKGEKGAWAKGQLEGIQTTMEQMIATGVSLGVHVMTNQGGKAWGDVIKLTSSVAQLDSYNLFRKNKTEDQAKPEDSKNAFYKSIDSFKEIGTGFVGTLRTRADKATDSPYDFFNWLTLGITGDIPVGIYEAAKDRSEHMFDSKEKFADWLTLGTVEMAKGAFNPDEAWSADHWLNSLGMVTLLYGPVEKSLLPTGSGGLKPPKGIDSVKSFEVQKPLPAFSTNEGFQFKINNLDVDTPALPQTPMQINFKNEMDRILREKMEGKSDSNHSIKDVELKAVEGTGKGKGGSRAPHLNNIDEFLSGSKTFDEVVNDYAKHYVEVIDTKGWSWEKSISGGDSLTGGQKKLIKSKAEELNLISKIEVRKVDGMRYGFADFEGAGVVVHSDELPKDLWKKGDTEQFDRLNDNLPEDIRKLVENGSYTWHHTEVPGKMQLVPYGIHNITTHNGGRSTGMWADAAR
ncbi:HNH endonuclease [Paenibacillus nitricinens]|uniref:HNH endonuclease signature motif containing protein n=1 Tax=Paenibacillus nitricinens TaxID=3367691 RepID=UPI003F87BE72